MRSTGRLATGALDTRLNRDDLMRHPSCRSPRAPHELPFSIDDRKILSSTTCCIRATIRAALDALIDFGRPRAIQLIVLVDRGHGAADQGGLRRQEPADLAEAEHPGAAAGN